MPYVRVRAAGTNINAPAAIKKNPTIIPFLYPTLFKKKGRRDRHNKVGNVKSKCNKIRFEMS
jgi:hypothetical protein